MILRFEPFEQTVVLGDDQVLSYTVSGIEDFKAAEKRGEWREDKALTKYEGMPRYRNDQREILEAVPAQGLCYQFKNEEELNLYELKVVIIAEDQKAYPIAMIDRADFEYLSNKYELKLIPELTNEPDEIYQVPDGRIIYVDSHWKEGMIYRNRNEYLVVTRLEGDAPMVAIPHMIVPSQSESEGQH